MILVKVRLDYGIAIAIASFKIVVLLLEDRRTAYLKFKILIKLTETSMLNISQQSELTNLIHIIKLIIWDKASMAYKFTFKVVDRIFRNITQINKLFGSRWRFQINFTNSNLRNT